ncbi:MAG TPA: DUF3306 domain-containing protein [Steroidobacteraceae bacterium]|nr:DUF3306 domain-containing protein [Steroidobacteraceae bacterium]
MSKQEPPRPAAGDESFLQRWSRLKSEAPERKRESAAGVAEPGPGADVDPGAEAEARAPVLPSLDELGDDSDYSAFLSPEVDESLRRQALRRLFRSPKFNVCDGLDDYCDDFTQFAPLGGIVTADMRHQVERAAKEALARLEESASRDSESAAKDESVAAAAAARDGLGSSVADQGPEQVGDEDRGPA